MKYLVLYLVIINIVMFLVMYVDKKRAIKHKSRVPEKKLFLIAFLGGMPIMLVSMKYLHHKNKKTKFKIVLLLVFLLQIAIGFLVYKIFSMYIL